MSYARTNRQRSSRAAPSNGRSGPAYQAAVDVVRQRALQGEPCYFWRKRPACPSPHFDWRLPHNDPWAFTAHHLDHLMDGAPVVPHPDRMAPAHRSCNAWDGLRRQNARRRQQPSAPPIRSRDW